VVILGAVKNPGTFVLRSESRILDLISMAGGIDPTGGKRILLLKGAMLQTKERVIAQSSTEDKSTSKPEEDAVIAEALSSGAAKPIVIDYYRLVHEGDLTQNLVVEGGDMINIPKANEIYVLGSVARPGPVKYEDHMGILQAVTLAGGPTPEASPKSTYILRQGEKGEKKIEIRFDQILKNKTKNVPIQPDDVIVIPESFF
jgi:polysaccharide export outer membrane protein